MKTHKIILDECKWNAVFWYSKLPFTLVKQSDITSFIRKNPWYKWWAQCVSFIQFYAKQRGWAITKRGNAIDLWKSWLWPRWKRIESKPTNMPQEGDIVVWNEKWWGWYGHIAVANKLCSPMTLRTVDQNAWSGNGDGLGKNAINSFFRTYSGVLWWFHYDI